MRAAVVAPLWFAVPRTGYGVIEIAGSLLPDGYVDARQHVTLSRSGGSRTKTTLVSTTPKPPHPRDPRTPSYAGFHTLASYLQMDEFDVVHDHAGIVGPICGALL